jgi:hypothetical protein
LAVLRGARRRFPLGLGGLAWVGAIGLTCALSCSIFPDEATLPMAAAGDAGAALVGASGGGGQGTDMTPSAGAGEGGTPGSDGGAAQAGMAGTPGMAELGGAGGAFACANPQSLLGFPNADTWIEMAKPTTGHGKDDVLVVSAADGMNERALLDLALPAVSDKELLLKATLNLHLEANADQTLVARQLRAHRLAHAVVETRTTWNNWGQGTLWETPGGDFEPAFAEATVPSGMSEGVVAFDVTAAVRAALAVNETSISFVILEGGSAPPPPAELSFGSRTGLVSGMPALIIESCSP